MTLANRTPADPIDNLAIGKLIEVDGSHIIAELAPAITELTRIYAGDAYPIGQFGSIIKIHFGRRIIYALVSRLRMKSEYEAERGALAVGAADERIIEADLFGEGEWVHDSAVVGVEEWVLQFERGVSTYPLPQQTIYMTPRSLLKKC